ncbi:sterol homeostasis protein [Coemansia javaensis]|uniref:Protein ARV n=1 Tax=Coemansia javaensis TaxID=2761396 RepID=A0A9W8HH00_9FUNG|nr:sterol homeostasis protein [Coemansia javaensis]
MVPLQHYAHTLICTLSATSIAALKDAAVISCNRIGCECHVLDDPQYRVVLPLVVIAIATAGALTLGPRTPGSPLMAESAESVGPAGAKQVCVECGSPVSALYAEYGAGHIRLTQCNECKSFADKYVEHDVVIMFIDMLLHKPQVYRHLLVNKLEFRRPLLERHIAKLGILLVLFNVYIDWFRLEEGGRLRGQRELLFGRQLSFAAQYLVILAFSAVDAAAQLGGILLASGIHQRSTRVARRWATVATALIISGFGKVLMILLVIWDYNEAYYPWLLDFLQFTSQSTAVSVLFDTHVVWAGLVVAWCTM